MTLNQIRNFAIALVLSAVAAFGQTALTTTTLTANVTNRQIAIPVTATTGMAVPANAGVAQGGIGSPASYTSSLLYVDHELMQIAAINGLNVTVSRGFGGTKFAAHVSSSVIYVLPRVATFAYEPTGQCQRTLLTYVPVIVPSTGHKFDCLGLTTAGQWFQTDSPGGTFGIVGSTVTPASTITPTGLIFATTSGATAIDTITVPAGWGVGMSITIIPGGTGATTTSGNIGLVTSALVVGRAITFTWSGSKWWPSYVS